jgi:hypothetical protein
MRLGTAFDRVLPAIGTIAFALAVGAVLATAGRTLGYDFLAYHAAAVRVLDGQPAYDTSFQAAGAFGLFYYPPTFLPLVLPFGLLPASVATWAWIGLLVAAFAIGVAVMPVSGLTKWLVVLLAATSWPFLYAVKLGQVGPLLFALFAIGWRALDRPALLGTAGALGTAIKMQPGLVLAWALLTRRFRAALIGIIVLAVFAVLASLVAGVRSWSDFVLLVSRVADPITTPHNFTPGAVAYQAGIPRGTAALVQWVSMALVLLAFVGAALWLPSVPSYLVAILASQLLSPILWDHYTLVLLLPVAWLVNRGWTWAALIPLATNILLVGVTPPAAHPLAFGITLLAVLAAGITDRRRPGVYLRLELA